MHPTPPPHPVHHKIRPVANGLAAQWDGSDDPLGIVVRSYQVPGQDLGIGDYVRTPNGPVRVVPGDWVVAHNDGTASAHDEREFNELWS